MESKNSTTHILGIDIAKFKFDIALIINGKFKNKVFDNNETGFIALVDWLKAHHVTHVHACMEATGIYWEALATFLADGGHLVSVVNPAQISAYAKSTLQRGKTDVQDARLIARYCEREQPEGWHPVSANQRVLLQLVRQLAHLNEAYQAEQHRLKTSTRDVYTSIAETMDFLRQQMKALSAKIDAHIDQDPTLRHSKVLLDSIPGVGSKTACWLILALVSALGGASKRLLLLV